MHILDSNDTMTPASLVYAAYEHLQHWKPALKILPPEKLLSAQERLFPLFSYCYHKTRELYSRLPQRKNGQDPFIHPFNVVWGLRKAHVSDPLTLSTGFLHDYVEERVDLYKEQHHLAEQGAGIRILDNYEAAVFKELEKDLVGYCTQQQISTRTARTIIDILKLLTRHKRHFYYRSIAAIFNCDDRELKERALQIKLADRMHNILTLDSFGEQERLYECFKNLFILNNTKQFLLDEYGLKVIQGTVFSPTEKLFNKCARATYDAFLEVCHRCSHSGISSVTSMLQLAFKKFALEKEGVWAVTAVSEKEVHLLRLYQGVIRKYDARLHHEFKNHDAMKKKELVYCRDFFRDYHFSEPQLQALICYKDSYSMKEVVAYLIYQPEYVLAHFVCSELSREGRIKRRT